MKWSSGDMIYPVELSSRTLKDSILGPQPNAPLLLKSFANIQRYEYSFNGVPWIYVLMSNEPGSKRRKFRREITRVWCLAFLFSCPLLLLTFYVSLSYFLNRCKASLWVTLSLKYSLTLLLTDILTNVTLKMRVIGLLYIVC